MNRARLVLLGATLLVAATAGCGRKGPLEEPPGAAVTGPPAQQQDQRPVSQRTSTPGDIEAILRPDTGGGP